MIGKFVGSQEGVTEALPGMLIGFLAPQFIPIPGSKGRSIADIPFTRMAGAVAAAFGPGGERWRDWLNNSDEGRRFMNRFNASVVRNGLRAYDVYQHGFYRDTKGRRIEVPYGAEGTEALAMMGGFTTTRSAERRAYTDWLRPDAYRKQATHSQLVRSAAAAVIADDNEKAWRIILDALNNGIIIGEDEIETQIERMNEDQEEGFVQQLPMLMRRR